MGNVMMLTCSLLHHKLCHQMMSYLFILQRRKQAFSNFNFIFDILLKMSTNEKLKRGQRNTRNCQDSGDAKFMDRGGNSQNGSIWI